MRGEFTKPKSSATKKFENVLCFCLCYECMYVVLEMMQKERDEEKGRPSQTVKEKTEERENKSY